MEGLLPDGVEPISALPEELEIMAERIGEPRYRGRQLFSWLHRAGAVDPGAMTDLPLGVRDRLEREWPDLGAVRVGQVLRAADGTRKIEVALRDGAAVETVLIPEGAKLTQCVSTQVGCAVGCAFCASGANGLSRNLTAAEIVGQIGAARAERLPGERLSNVVLMGVGEPLHNLGAVSRALSVMGHPDGLGLSARRITVSTVGVPRGIDRLGEATGGRTALAVSLHASDEAARARLVPGAGATPSEIVAALERYPLPRRRRFTIECVLVRGVNDGDRDALGLHRLLARLPVKVNLLPLNPLALTDLEPPDEGRVLAFREVLASKGTSAFVRRRRGADIGAACGQLVSRA